MPTFLERSAVRSFFFSFGELEVLDNLKISKEQREQIVDDQLAASDARLQKPEPPGLNSRESSPIMESIARKKGEPDWDEVKRDAIREMAHKMAAETEL